MADESEYSEQCRQKQGFSNPPPISEMMQSQGAGSTGNKFTNVFMPNQQQAVVEYTSQLNVPVHFHKKYPLLALVVESKRALGIENEIESWVNDNQLNIADILDRIGYIDLAEKEALKHLYHRDGQRTRNGFERDHQVMQKTLSDEKLTTVSQPHKTSFWSKVSKFGQGKNKPPNMEQIR